MVNHENNFLDIEIDGIVKRSFMFKGAWFGVQPVNFWVHPGYPGKQNSFSNFLVG